MSETPGQAFRRAQLETGWSNRQFCEMLDTSLSAVNYAKNGRRSVPRRWLPLLPPEMAVPVIEAVIAECYADITELEALLQAKKKSRLGGSTGTQIGVRKIAETVYPKPYHKASTFSRPSHNPRGNP